MLKTKMVDCTLYVALLINEITSKLHNDGEKWPFFTVQSINNHKSFQYNIIKSVEKDFKMSEDSLIMNEFTS